MDEPTKARDKGRTNGGGSSGGKVWVVSAYYIRDFDYDRKIKGHYIIPERYGHKRNQLYGYSTRRTRIFEKYEEATGWQAEKIALGLHELKSTYKQALKQLETVWGKNFYTLKFLAPSKTQKRKDTGERFTLKIEPVVVTHEKGFMVENNKYRYPDLRLNFEAENFSALCKTANADHIKSLMADIYAMRHSYLRTFGVISGVKL